MERVSFDNYWIGPVSNTHIQKERKSIEFVSIEHLIQCVCVCESMQDKRMQDVVKMMMIMLLNILGPLQKKSSITYSLLYHRERRPDSIRVDSTSRQMCVYSINDQKKRCLTLPVLLQHRQPHNIRTYQFYFLYKISSSSSSSSPLFFLSLICPKHRIKVYQFIYKFILEVYLVVKLDYYVSCR